VKRGFETPGQGVGEDGSRGVEDSVSSRRD